VVICFFWNTVYTHWILHAYLFVLVHSVNGSEYTKLLNSIQYLNASHEIVFSMERLKFSSHAIMIIIF